MKSISGMRIDQVAVVKLEIEPAAEVNSLRATVAYVDSKSNENLAYAEVNNVWSTDTTHFLAELIASVESDVVGHVTGSGATERIDDRTGGVGPGLFKKD